MADTDPTAQTREELDSVSGKAASVIKVLWMYGLIQGDPTQDVHPDGMHKYMVAPHISDKGKFADVMMGLFPDILAVLQGALPKAK